MHFPLLSLLVWLPFLAAILCLLIPKRYSCYAAHFTLFILAIELLLTSFTFYNLHTAKGIYAEDNFLWVERYRWLEIDLGGDFGQLRIDYLLGIDGLNGPLLLLAVLLFLVGLQPSWRTSRQPRHFFSLYLLMFGAVMGTLCSMDLLLLFIFFEFLVLPTYLLIAFWGGDKRASAALQFLLYTLSGSALIFFVLLGLCFSVYMPETFPAEENSRLIHRLDLMWMMHTGNYSSSSPLSPESSYILWGLPLRSWAFFALMLGLAIKLPVVPFHAWLPKAHVEASTGMSIVLAGVLLKLGGYGFMRIGLGVFPDQVLQHASLLAFFGVLSIVYASLVALVQQDLKRLIAYSSISHMGFVLLGISSTSGTGFIGALYQMISHGLISAAMFFLAGIVEQRCGTRQIDHLSGLSAKMPFLGGFALMYFFAAFGLPGFSSFVAELFVLIGTFEAIISRSLSWLFVLFIVLGMLFMAACFVWAYRRTFQGPYWLRHPSGTAPATLSDLRTSEAALLLSVAVLVVGLGVYPQPLLEAMYTTLNHLKLLVYTYGSP